MNAQRIGVMKGFDVGVALPGMPVTHYMNDVDLCSVLDEYKHCPNVKIYFAEKHLVDPFVKTTNTTNDKENIAAPAKHHDRKEKKTMTICNNPLGFLPKLVVTLSQIKVTSN